MDSPKITPLGHGNSQLNLNVILDDTELERVNKTNILGVIIDENLTWKNHIDGITKTISRNIGMLLFCFLFVCLFWGFFCVCVFVAVVVVFFFAPERIL